MTDKIWCFGNDEDGNLGKMMHDFRCKEAKDMHAGALADRVHELKETKNKEKKSGFARIKNVVSRI